MSDLPPPILDYVNRQVFARRRPAYLSVDGEGRLSSSGGDVAHYGLAQLGAGDDVQATAGFLVGLLPAPDEPLVLNAVQTAEDVFADVHVMSADGADWVLLLDATEQAEASRALQQRGNELSLLRDELARQNEALEAANTEIRQAHEDLHAEQRKSEQLLRSVLPEAIAERLKEGPELIAESFDDATVMFADIHEFSARCRDMSATESVRLLNDVFSTFDALGERLGMEKIKTVGDAYMVAGGVPVPRPDHVEAIAEMALGMQEAILTVNARGGEPLSLCIGIDTGPLVAGVIGTKRFVYDLWGRTVNTAAHLETYGVPGGIQVTQSTYERLEDKYLFEQRGTFYIKGRGEVTTYLLRGRRQEVAQGASSAKTQTSKQ